MVISLLLAAAATSHVPGPLARNEPIEQVDVAYEALAAGRAQDAIDQINANDALEQDDPARLINLGTALAALGRFEEARSMYEAAAAHGGEVYLETAEGRWIRARTLARQADERLDYSVQLARR